MRSVKTPSLYRVSLEHASGTTPGHDSRYALLLRGLHRDFEVR
jgi:hypothetical protein